jgi:hypothetical protein|tara:strand:+ start:135 stop:263 length:129 start_codon:yes stop_codon:yes gene_type:complete
MMGDGAHRIDNYTLFLLVLYWNIKALRATHYPHSAIEEVPLC